MIDLSTKKLFVFDFDGTLVQSNAIKRASLYEVSAHVPGSRRILDELLRDERLDRYSIFRELAARTGVEPVALVTAYSELCEARILAGPEVPGGYDLLQALNERKRICVINSATPEEPLRALVKRLRFSPLICATYGKPAGKMENLSKAMTFAKIDAGATIVLGDGEGDRKSAEQVGCAFVGVVSDSNDFSANPEVMVDRLDRLVEWL